MNNKNILIQYQSYLSELVEDFLLISGDDFDIEQIEIIPLSFNQWKLIQTEIASKYNSDLFQDESTLEIVHDSFR